jgi:tryptophanyl-tRNA synthetase
MAAISSPAEQASPTTLRPRRILSGITPSGSLTLGNYLGALTRFVDSQYDEPSGPNGDDRAASTQRFFFVSDLHALTTEHDPEALRKLTAQTAALFFASGLDPALSTVFLQSQVPAHVQLSYLLESTAHVGELNRMIQFKEKGARPGTRASLFTYPCLMAADILLYDTDTVPVGGDQDQHVELCRDLAVRFNRLYGETFVVPKLSRAALAARVADLADPAVKMSKSAPQQAAGVIRMLDSPDLIRRKISRAVTDSERDVRYDPETKPGVSNLLDILAAISRQSLQQLASRFTSYGELKAACADSVISALEPVQRRYAELGADPGELGRMLQAGAERAREQSSTVLTRARSAIGLVDLTTGRIRL